MPSRPRVRVTDRAWPDLTVERHILSPVGADVFDAAAADDASLACLARDVDAIITNWARVAATVIRGAIRCRVIARTGIGLDNIDVHAATAMRIPVTNVPDYCVGEV